MSTLAIALGLGLGLLPSSVASADEAGLLSLPQGALLPSCSRPIDEVESSTQGGQPCDGPLRGALPGLVCGTVSLCGAFASRQAYLLHREDNRGTFDGLPLIMSTMLCWSGACLSVPVMIGGALVGALMEPPPDYGGSSSSFGRPCMSVGDASPSMAF